MTLINLLQYLPLFIRQEFTRHRNFDAIALRVFFFIHSYSKINRAHNPIAKLFVTASPQERARRRHAELAAAGTGDVWDSGRVDLTVPWLDHAGPPLASRTRYHWAVRAWDEQGQPTAWSAPSTALYTGSQSARGSTGKPRPRL